MITITFEKNKIIIPFIEDETYIKYFSDIGGSFESKGGSFYFIFINTYNILRKISYVIEMFNFDSESRIELGKQMGLWETFLLKHCAEGDVEDDEILFDHQRTSKKKLVTIMEEHPYNIMTGRKSVLELSEVRTGKTPKIISIITDLQEKGVDCFVIVTPASLTYNFEGQAQELFGLESINFSKVKIPNRKEVVADFRQYGGILIISVSLIKNMLEDFKKLKNCMLIVDEADFLRNSGSKQTDAIKMLSGRCDGAILMTGTPLSGKLENIGNYYKVMWPSLFTSTVFFSDYFFTKFEMRVGARVIEQYGGLKEIHKDEYYEIKELCSDKVMQDDCLTWRAAQTTEDVVMLEMDEAQKEIYDVFVQNNVVYVGDDGFIKGDILGFINSNKHICQASDTLSKLTRCRQLSNNSDSIKESFKLGILDSKTEFIINWVKENPKERVIIADVSTSYLKILHGIFGDRCGFIHGGVSSSERTEIIEKFRSGEIKILIAQTKTISHGHTFDFCDNIIISSLDWNPNVNEQLKNRITDTKDYEIHNEKRIIILANNGTIDELVTQANDDKINVMSIINSPNKLKDFLNKYGFEEMIM